MPGVLGLDWEGGWLVMEWVEGRMVRETVAERVKNLKETAEEQEQEGSMRRLMGRMGRAVGRLHTCGVVHGDLTTSNMMVRESGEGEEEVVLIDFGLAAQTVQDEDRAVDLYVLERAFGSTHSQVEGLFAEVLRAYGESFKGAEVVLKRLEDVRMRGRKRSMLG